MKNFYIVVNGSEIHFEAENIEDAIMMAADTTFSPPLAVFEKKNDDETAECIHGLYPDQCKTCARLYASGHALIADEWDRLAKIKADVSILKNAYKNFAEQYEQDRFDRIVSCAEHLASRRLIGPTLSNHVVIPDAEFAGIVRQFEKLRDVRNIDQLTQLEILAIDQTLSIAQKYAPEGK